MAENIREPVVAGQFYEGTESGLQRQIEGCYERAGIAGGKPTVNENGPRDILGLVSPHAGYQFSGTAAAEGFARLAEDGVPDVFVIIGPNHGRGSRTDAIQTDGYWQTPLGQAPIASEMAEDIASAMPNFTDDSRAFAGEHSIEVQLPFIQHLYGADVAIVPIMMLGQTPTTVENLGNALADALEGENVVIIASTDMTHFQSAEVAEKQDSILIERMEALDPDGLLRERERRDISMCGCAPTAAMLIAANALGAAEAEKIAYTNSGDATGDYREVVAYLSMVVRKA